MTPLKGIGAVVHQVLQHSLEALIEAADGTEIVRDIRTVSLRTQIINGDDMILLPASQDSSAECVMDRS